MFLYFILYQLRYFFLQPGYKPYHCHISLVHPHDTRVSDSADPIHSTCFFASNSLRQQFHVNFWV
ncbi:hypothetical protein HanPSC8_Chr08g0308541 [Helianthus annuus]|nr:hypothetical protein HanPSC8_Chr08g0308541 [Helianthus annuus]